mgnify:CR=1 FL=1
MVIPMKIIKSIDEEKVREISKIKNEPKWMTEFRVNSYKKFMELKNPKFGPALSIDFDIINYYNKKRLSSLLFIFSQKI